MMSYLLFERPIQMLEVGSTHCCRLGRLLRPNTDFKVYVEIEVVAMLEVRQGFRVLRHVRNYECFQRFQCYDPGGNGSCK